MFVCVCVCLLCLAFWYKGNLCYDQGRYLCFLNDSGQWKEASLDSNLDFLAISVILGRLLNLSTSISSFVRWKYCYL